MQIELWPSIQSVSSQKSNKSRLGSAYLTEAIAFILAIMAEILIIANNRTDNHENIESNRDQTLMLAFTI